MRMWWCREKGILCQNASVAGYCKKKPEVWISTGDEPTDADILAYHLSADFSCPVSATQYGTEGKEENHSAYIDKYGIGHCGYCDAELVCNDCGDMPKICRDCGRIIVWSGWRAQE